MGGREIHPCPGCGTDIHDDMESCGRRQCAPAAVRGARDAQITALWELVREHLAERSFLPGELARLEARFRAGAIEHGDDWTTWDDARFEQEIQDELDDIRLYRAMGRAARAGRAWRPRGAGAS